MRRRQNAGFNSQVVEGIVFAVISIFVITIASGMNPYRSWALAPGLFPIIVGAIILVLSVSLIIQGLRKRDSKTGSFDRVDWLRILLVMGLTIVYVWLLPLLGFIAVSIPYLALMLLILGEKRWWLVGTISVGTILSLYYAFGVLLSVYLP